MRHIDKMTTKQNPSPAHIHTNNSMTYWRFRRLAWRFCFNALRRAASISEWRAGAEGDYLKDQRGHLFDFDSKRKSYNEMKQIGKRA
jgi:hypothetical protein